MKKILLILLAFAFIACSDNSTSPSIDPDELQEGKMIFDFSDDEWKSSGVVFNTLGEFTSIIGIKDSSLLESAAILIENEILPGYTYPASMTVTEFTVINNNIALNVWVSAEKGCTVKIKSVTEERISGTFTAKLKNNLGDSLTIDNGAFNATKM